MNSSVFSHYNAIITIVNSSSTLFPSVHLRVEEKISLTCGRDGGLQNMEVLGIITLKVTDEKNGRISILLNNNDKKGAQLQVCARHNISCQGLSMYFEGKVVDSLIFLEKNTSPSVTFRLPKNLCLARVTHIVSFILQTHPHVDKKLFTNESLIGLKNQDKSFPLNTDLGVLKWRIQSTDEALIPLTSEY